jgi:hypothetical protein
VKGHVTTHENNEQTNKLWEMWNILIVGTVILMVNAMAQALNNGTKNISRLGGSCCRLIWPPPKTNNRITSPQV